MTILLAIVAGALVGWVLERGDFCFHSLWRGIFAEPREGDLARAYVLLLLLSTPIVSVMRWGGVIDPWIPPLAWGANVIGGLVFGVGMVIAATCVTGMFYKFGHGMFGAGVAILGWSLGDVVTHRGPLEGLRDRLREDPVLADGEAATVDNWIGPIGIIAVLLLAAGAAWHLYARRFQPGRMQRGRLAGWLPLGIGLAGAMVVGWLLVEIDGGDYSFGTAGVPTQLWDWSRGNAEGASWWIPLGLISLIPGAYLAAKRSDTFWARGESAQRYGQLALGGAVMGIGAALAGGCNLGHSMVGVPLLSMGSIVTTLAMGVGVFAAAQLRR